MHSTLRQSLRSILKLALPPALAFPLICFQAFPQSCGVCSPTSGPPNPPYYYVWDTDCCCWVYSPPSGGSPIIIDTTGTGFHLTSAEQGVFFDISGTGHPIKIAWTEPGSGNAFLALDRDGDGKIDSGKELFGNFTEQPPSPNPNGFLALAEFDKPENGGNGDGIIDSRDAVFSNLRLWIDDNHDGISQPSELHTLPELGIFSLSLKYTISWYTDQYDNHFRYKGVVNPDPKDGTSKDGRFDYDVFLEIAGLDASASLPASTNSQPREDTFVSGHAQRSISLYIANTTMATAETSKFAPSPESRREMVPDSLSQLGREPPPAVAHNAPNEPY